MKKKNLIMILLIILVIIILGLVVYFLKQKENSNDVNQSKQNYYIVDGAIYEKLEEVNENTIKNNVKKINNIFENHLNNMNVYFSTIPSKEYYLDNENSANNEFKYMENMIKSELNESIKYIEISDTLDLTNFYKTDMHWKQESLAKTVEKLEEEMNVESTELEYEKETLGDFYGTYYKELNDTTIGQDELIYLTNSMIENSTVYNEEKNIQEPVYNLPKTEETNNKYDVFLSGATAIQEIENKSINNGKKLIIFRDSFGSSIVPLLIKDYGEILLVDIRYVNSNLLSNYIDFNEYENQDVLFLYNSRVINKSGIFR